MSLWNRGLCSGIWLFSYYVLPIQIPAFSHNEAQGKNRPDDRYSGSDRGPVKRSLGGRIVLLQVQVSTSRDGWLGHINRVITICNMRAWYRYDRSIMSTCMRWTCLSIRVIVCMKAYSIEIAPSSKPSSTCSLDRGFECPCWGETAIQAWSLGDTTPSSTNI